MFYVSGGRTIIFTETKDSASQLAGILPGARALHGDIQQATREVKCQSICCRRLPKLGVLEFFMIFWACLGTCKSSFWIKKGSAYIWIPPICNHSF